MITLPFARRGPFKIAGKIDRYHWDKPSPRLLGVFWVVPFNSSKPDFGFYNWYRKPSLADRGPFEFGGLVTCKGWSPVIMAYYSCVDCVEDALERGPGDELTGWYCAATRWIYYSRNISTANTCH